MPKKPNIKRPLPERFIIRNSLTGDYYCRKKWVPRDPKNPLGDGYDRYFRPEHKRAKVFYSKAAAKVACHHIHQTTQYKRNDTYGQDLDLDKNLEILSID